MNNSQNNNNPNSAGYNNNLSKSNLAKSQNSDIIEECPHSRKVSYMADRLYYCENKESCADKVLFGYTTNYCGRYLR